MTASTTDLSDRYEGFGRVLPLVSHRHFGKRIRFSGPAVTIKCFEDNSRLKELAAEPGRARVLVVDGGGSARCALLGDLIAREAAANGWSGIVVDGCVRDTVVLGTIEIGIVARGSCPRRGTRRGEGTAEIPVEIGGVACAPGDLVFADEDGVFVIEPRHMTS